ncbi:hypothetical protein HNQ75_004542 [Rhizobium flavum]|uniref:Transposase n=1 Tax=Pseudorhizobium flavum TaxID=1335061 RepID=A0A7X0DF05_9HYPH|nr:hypothetical protein [Pseudorhizobium flavum]
MEEAVVVADVPTGPKEAHSTVLSLEDEAVVVAFRKHTLLPLDDCLYALQPARRPWCRIRWDARQTWSRKRRMNSSPASIMTCCRS